MTINLKSGRWWMCDSEGRPVFFRIQRQCLVQWKGSGNPTWVDEEELNCGALLQEFDLDRVSKNCFEVKQSQEKMEDK